MAVQRTYGTRLRLLGSTAVRQVGPNPSVNPAPVDIYLSGTSINYNAASGTVLGTVTVNDIGDTQWTFALGGADASKFTLVGANPAASIVVQRSGSGALTADGTADITLTATDGNGGFLTKPFTISTPDPASAVLLTTFTIANTSASPESAGKVSQLFGVLVPPGKIPNGKYPQIRLNDGTTVQEAYIAARVNYPADHPTAPGSWRFFACAFRLPATAGNATNTYRLYQSGTSPATSGLTNGSAAAADLGLEITGVTNLTGVWLASVNTGVTDNDDISVYGDAGCARIISVGQDFMQSGSPHGQMYMKGYLMHLTDGSGAYAGSRYCLRAQQGWTDVSTPTPTRRTVNARLMSGASPVRTIQGYDAAVSLGTTFEFAQYQRFYSLGTDAKWDYVQAGGSQAADTTTGMPVFGKDWLSAGEMVCFDWTQTGISSNISYDYYHDAKGPIQRDLSSPGEWSYIGVVPAECARHFFNRAEVDFRAIRTIALMTSGWRTCLLDSSTKKIITGRNNAYTGLGTARPTWRYFPGTQVIGVQNPALELSATLWQSETEPSHRPNYPWYAYIMTGSPEYFDLTVELAGEIVIYATPGAGQFTTPPVTGGASCFSGGLSGRQPVVSAATYDGSLLAANANLVRLYAWAFRDLVQALSIQPETAFDGADIKGYFNDLVDANLGFFNAYTAYVTAASPNWPTAPYYMQNNGGGSDYEGAWTEAYLTAVFGATVAWTRKPAAVTAAERQRDFWNKLFTVGGAAACGAFHIKCRNENGDRLEDGDLVSVLMTAGPTLSWVASTDVFTMGGGPSPTNGDLIGWSSYDAPGSPGPWATSMKLFQVINASGQTFKLAQIGSGTPLDVTSDGSCTAFYGRVANCGSLPDYQNGWDYLPGARMAIRMMEQAGITGLSTTAAGLDAAFNANNPTEGPASPKYLAATAFATV
jgi:hypothetical protein